MSESSLESTGRSPTPARQGARLRAGLSRSAVEGPVVEGLVAGAGGRGARWRSIPLVGDAGEVPGAGAGCQGARGRGVPLVDDAGQGPGAGAYGRGARRRSTPLVGDTREKPIPLLAGAELEEAGRRQAAEEEENREKFIAHHVLYDRVLRLYYLLASDDQRGIDDWRPHPTDMLSLQMQADFLQGKLDERKSRPAPSVAPIHHGNPSGLQLQQTEVEMMVQP